MPIDSSFDLLVFLKEQGIVANTRDTLWWPNSGTFEAFVGAILTQNTKWTQVEKSLDALRVRQLLTLEAMANLSENALSELIRPSGFANQKAVRLIRISQNIIEDFGNFASFQEGVSREWLLEQKGIGQESADSILCYACAHEAMVVDKYTQKLLASMGLEFESYEDIQDFLVRGIDANYDKITALYGYDISLCEIYARLHGKIVEYMKQGK